MNEQFNARTAKSDSFIDCVTLDTNKDAPREFQAKSKMAGRHGENSFCSQKIKKTARAPNRPAVDDQHSLKPKTKHIIHHQVRRLPVRKRRHKQNVTVAPLTRPYYYSFRNSGKYLLHKLMKNLCYKSSGTLSGIFNHNYNDT